MIRSVQRQLPGGLELRKRLRKARAGYHKLFFAKRSKVLFEQGAFSFTFDDVPYSTIVEGIPILNNLNVKGTFYIASQLANGCQLPTITERFASMSDIVDIYNMGHDIGCHTFSHYNLRNGDASELHWDARKNRTELAKFGIDVRHFAFPYGSMSLAAKKVLGVNYNSMRSTYPGINHGAVDMRCLHVYALYSDTLDRKFLEKIIDKTIEKKGWTIFYTHGVEVSPNRFGCTPEDLLWVMQKCNAAGGRILSIDEASRALINATD